MKIIMFFILCISFLMGFDSFSYPTQIIKVDEKTATINKGNLAEGQSGIVIHRFKDENEAILAFGVVEKSNERNTTIKFIFKDIIEQDAIPTTNLKPQIGDMFLVSHLYDTAMFIVPNYEALEAAKTLFTSLNLVDTDIFAGFLKIEEEPVPKLEDFQKFAKMHSAGVLVFVVEDKAHVIDVISKKEIAIKNINYDDNTTALPFFTNVEEIKTGVFDFFSEESIGDYNKYYKKLLGIKNDGK